LIDYINYYNDKLYGSEWHHQQSDLRYILDKIRDDLSVPYYILSQMMIMAGHDMGKFVHLINEWKEETVASNNTLDVKEKHAFLFKSSFRYPTVEDVGKLEFDEIAGTYRINTNGLGLLDGKTYSYLSRRCSLGCWVGNYLECKVLCFCIKCAATTCGCSLEYSCWSENPDGEGYICNTCLPIDDNIDYYPTVEDLDNKSDQDNGYIIASSVNGCLRYKMANIDLKYCRVILKCQKCNNRTCCSCSSKLSQWIVNPSGNGFICSYCVKKL
jgi:hypothetical protein